jgi:rubrerythrin
VGTKIETPLPRIQSEEELLVIACALEAKAARHYRDLAHWAADTALEELAALFRGLAEMKEAHVGAVRARGGRLPGRPLEPAGARWNDPTNVDEEEARSSRLTPYRVLAIAVRNEERAFTFYAYVAAEAGSPGLRALAEDLARDELEHAAILRRERRRAFRGERSSPLVIPGDVASLRSASIAWERQEEATQETASACRIERNFERYMEIAERAKDDKVVAEAQRLAEAALHRLALVRGRRGNPLIKASQ